MKTKHAKQIREGILLARQVIRHERIGPYRKPYSEHKRDMKLAAYLRTMHKLRRPPKGGSGVSRFRPNVEDVFMKVTTGGFGF